MGSSSKTSSIEDSIRDGASEELEDTEDSGDGNPAVWHESQRETENWLRSVAIASDEFADLDVLQGEEANNPLASPWVAGDKVILEHKYPLQSDKMKKSLWWNWLNPTVNHDLEVMNTHQANNSSVQQASKNSIWGYASPRK